MKPKGPFVYVVETDDGSRYEARFPIADDGTPDNEQFLRVVIHTTGATAEVRISRWSRHSEAIVLDTNEVNFDAVAQLLYGAATVVTAKRLQPL